MKKVLITGSGGIIGSILSKGLTKYKLTFADRPNIDARDYSQLLEKARGVDAIIHLAWDTKNENFQSETINPENSEMFENVYRAALEKKIP